MDACKCKKKKKIYQNILSSFLIQPNSLCRSSSVLESVLVELLPPHAQANQRRNARASNAHGKDDLDARHVAVNDEWLLVDGESVADLGGARQDEHGLADLRSVLDDVANHGVDKGRLGSRDEESSAEALEEEEHTGGRAEVRWVGQCLDGNHGDLEGCAPAGASNDLVSDPFSGGCGGAQGVQETSADGGEGCSTEEQRLVVSSYADQRTASNS